MKSEETPPVHRSRRSVLAAGAAGAAVLIAQSVRHPEGARAADGDPLLMGHGENSGENEATSSTWLKSDATPVFFARNVAGTGTGVAGQSASGFGVSGSSGDGNGVLGEASTGTGVFGISSGITAGTSHNTGVIGMIGLNPSLPHDTNETGVYGYASASAASIGAWGDSVDGTGVVATGDWGLFASGSTLGIFADVVPTATGIYAHVGASAAPAPTAGVALQATAGSTSQTALKVTGKAQFSRSGRTYISAGHASRVITMAGVTTASYIVATPQTNRAGVFVQAVVPSSGKFTIYLNKTVTGTTYVGFLVIN